MGSAMNLDDVTGVEETAEHFVVSHAKRGSFRLMKSAIPSDVADSIRSVAKGKAAAREAIANMPGPDGVTHAATGALVPTYEEQRGLPPKPPPYDPDSDPATFAALDGPAPLFDAQIPIPPTVHVNGSAGGAPGGGPITPGMIGGALDAVGSFLGNGLAAQEAFYAPAPEVPLVSDVPPAWPGPATLIGGNTTAVPVPAPVAAPEVAPAPAAAAAPRPSRDAGVPRAPSLDVAPFDTTKIDNAQRLQQQAIVDNGRAAHNLALEQKALQDETNVEMSRIAKDYNTKIGENQRRLQGLADDLASKPIQRQEMGWGATLAVALGAAGSSLTGGPNFALQIVNKRIDDDMAVQMAARNEKKNLVNFYQQQGQSLENSYRLAKADKLAEVAGQMQSAALQAGSQQAIAQAKAASGKLLEDAFRLTQEAYLSDFKAKTAPIAFRSELRGQQLGQQRAIAEIRLLEAQARLAPQKASSDAELARLKLENERADLANKQREGVVRTPQFVRGPNGVMRGADGAPIYKMVERQTVDRRDTESAKDIQNRMQGLEAVRQYRDLVRQDPSTFSPSDNKAFAAKRTALVNAIKAGAQGMSSDNDMQILLDGLPDNTVWGRVATDRATASLDALDDMFMGEIDTIGKSRLR